MKEKTCCFTGHREIPTEEYDEICQRTRKAIVSLIKKGVVFFGAGGARGFDTIAAESVLELKNDYPQIKLILVLPCPNQTRGWIEEDIRNYHDDVVRCVVDCIRVGEDNKITIILKGGYTVEESV